ncbi:MAG: histidine kinase, partial [Verrucomicrobiota bacterium]
ILIDQSIRQRAIVQTRERIGADLHDELGANLHAIALLGDLALAATWNPERRDKLLQRLKGATARTIDSTRYFTELLESKKLGESLVEDFQRASGRMLADLEHNLIFEGENFMNQLSPNRRLDLLLFYKESLANVLRHSGATHVQTEVTATNRDITLMVADNGRGLGAAPGNGVPPSLRRRARLLGARITVEPPADDGGARIRLRVPIRKPWNLLLRYQS